MRSSKAPPNQKNRGQFLPQPTRTHRSWHPNLPGAASNSAPELRVLGWVMLSVLDTKFSAKQSTCEVVHKQVVVYLTDNCCTKIKCCTL
jgi:hypothetical protein